MLVICRALDSHRQVIIFVSIFLPVVYFPFQLFGLSINQQHRLSSLLSSVQISHGHMGFMRCRYSSASDSCSLLLRVPSTGALKYRFNVNSDVYEPVYYLCQSSTCLAFFCQVTWREIFPTQSDIRQRFTGLGS